jgi:hypothetical protein
MWMPDGGTLSALALCGVPRLSVGHCPCFPELPKKQGNFGKQAQVHVPVKEWIKMARKSSLGTLAEGHDVVLTLM